MSTIKVSVILPVYNAERFIGQCLESILQQQDQALEFIFVDDESTDRSVEIIRQYQEKDYRIHLLMQPHGNAGVARNRGLAQAKGEYVHFMDSDDWLMPDVYTDWYDFACKTRADVCKAFYYRYNMQTGVTEQRGTSPDKNRLFISNLRTSPQHFFSSPVVPWDKLYNRDFLIRNHLQFDDLLCRNDRGFYFEMLLYAGRIAIYPKEVLTYRIGNSDQLSSTKSFDNFDCCFKSFDRIWPLYNLEKDQIKQLLIKATVLDFKHFYDLAVGEKRQRMHKQLRDYMMTMDFGCFGQKLTEQSWFEFYADICGLPKLTNEPKHESDNHLIKQLQKELNAQKAINNQLKHDLALITGSKSFRIGRMATYPVRKFRSMLRYKKTHTLGETIAYGKKSIAHTLHLAPKAQNISVVPSKPVIDMGIQSPTRSPRVIVSLTSFPARIGTVHHTIETLLRQTFRPDMVILWLAEDQFPQREADLPAELLRLKGFGLNIDWCEDLRSYKKLIPALRKYPEDIIVTVDDDAYYQENWLELLYRSFDESQRVGKQRIHCHRVTKFYKDALGDWKIIPASKETYKRPNYLHKLTGLGGVLYPPHSLHPDVLDTELFAHLAPTNDDIWFWLMAIRNGTRIKAVDGSQPTPSLIKGTQKMSLMSINDKGEQLFWKDFQRVVAHYPDVQKKLEREWELLYPLRHSPRYYAQLKESDYSKELENYYALVTGNDIDLDQPRTFNEKITWLKVFGATPEKTLLADKYLVRDWISDKIGSEYLIPLVGVWDHADEIDFNALPDSFVLKGNHGSGWNIIVRDKHDLDWEATKHTMEQWMASNYAYQGLEMHYRDIPPKIIAEQMLVNPDGDDDLRDYKFLCFGGKVYYVWVDTSRYTSHCRDVFDLEWNRLPVRLEYPNAESIPQKPKNFEAMVRLAEKLCEDFAFVRVDFYDVGGKIYFGEMTFTSGNGREQFIPPEYNLIWGDLIKLQEQRIQT